MTDPTARDLISRLADELDRYRQLLTDDRREAHALATEARAYLAAEPQREPQGEGPSDQELLGMAAKATGYSRISPGEYECEGSAIEAYGSELIAFARAVLARWGRPAIADTHYEWELEDADGEWQAGGSSNSLDDVEREGQRYLQTYAQDGPHKLIIRQHCTEIINEIATETTDA